MVDAHSPSQCRGARTWGSLMSRPSVLKDIKANKTCCHKIEQSKTKDKTDQGGFLVHMKYTHYDACTHMHICIPETPRIIESLFATKES